MSGVGNLAIQPLPLHRTPLPILAIFHDLFWLAYMMVTLSFFPNEVNAKTPVFMYRSDFLSRTQWLYTPNPQHCESVHSPCGDLFDTANRFPPYRSIDQKSVDI
jgi:hypothetical protein